MKFLLTVAAVIAVATALPAQRSLVSPILAGPVAVVDENNEPIAIGPAILDFEPVVIGPAIVDSFEPISVGPAIVDFPIAPSPVVIGPIAPGQPTPLVQIIINVNNADSAPIVPAPVVIPDIKPEPVIVVEQPEIVPEPVIIGPAIIPVEPVIIATPVIPVEPVIVGTPIIPAPAVILPDTLN